jgi:hypothetical protein
VERQERVTLIQDNFRGKVMARVEVLATLLDAEESKLKLWE